MNQSDYSVLKSLVDKALKSPKQSSTDLAADSLAQEV